VQAAKLARRRKAVDSRRLVEVFPGKGLSEDLEEVRNAALKRH
jgi:hypothetical protein